MSCISLGGSNSRGQFLPKLVFWSLLYLLVLLLGYGGLHGGFCANGWRQFACCRCWSSSRFGRSGLETMGSIAADWSSSNIGCYSNCSSYTATVPSTSTVPATSPVPATVPVPATAPVPATSPVPPTSVGMASSSAGLIDPSMTSAAATVAQPMAPPLAVPQIKYAARPMDYASLRLVALTAPRYRPEPYAAGRGRELSSSSSMGPKAGPITVPA